MVNLMAGAVGNFRVITEPGYINRGSSIGCAGKDGINASLANWYPTNKEAFNYGRIWIQKEK